MLHPIEYATLIRPEGFGAGERDRLRSAHFRRKLRLLAAPTEATITLTAADRYALSVNGVPVRYGPVKGDGFSRYYDTVDLLPYLVAGDNRIDAFVVSYALPETGSRETPGCSILPFPGGLCLLASGHVIAGGEAIPLDSDGSWLAAPGMGYLQVNGENALLAGGEEILDLSQLPRDADFRPAEPFRVHAPKNPWGEYDPMPLAPSPIPPLDMEEGSFAASVPLPENADSLAFGADDRATVKAGQTAEVILSVPTLTTGRLFFRTKGRGEIRIFYAERFFPADPSDHTGPFRRDDWENGVIRDDAVCDLVLPDTLEREARLFSFRAFRYVRVRVAAQADVTISRPRFLTANYPLEVNSRMEFPHRREADLWDISLRTLRMCMHETHEDCPYYEQLQYILDTRLQMLFTYAVSGDTRMARRVIHDFSASRLPSGLLQSRFPSYKKQVIPAFSLHWIFMLDEYYMQTGDKDYVRQYLPVGDGILEYFNRHIGQSGLVEKLEDWDFCDWTYEWKDLSHGIGVSDASRLGLPSAVHSLTYAVALRALAGIARACGREGLADEYDARAEDVCRAVNRTCFDAERGMYREAPTLAQFSQHAQAMAVLSGAAEGGLAQQALTNCLSDRDVVRCTYPWQYNLLRALDKAGLYDRAREILAPYYDLLNRALTTIPETPYDTRSDCHAWSALPLYEFPRGVLGVNPASPGWESIRIAPHLMGMEKLYGTVPTPKGDVTVAWEQVPDGMRYTVSCPPVPTLLSLPGGKQLEIRDGGITVVEK